MSFVVALCVLVLATSYGIELLRREWPDPLARGAVALALAGVNACAVNLVWGRVSLGLRAIALLTAIASASVLLACATRESWSARDVREWFAALGIFTAYVAGPLILARATGLVTRAGLQSPPSRRAIRFSVERLLSLITCAGATLAVAINGDFRGGDAAVDGRALATLFAPVTWLCVLTKASLPSGIDFLDDIRQAPHSVMEALSSRGTFAALASVYARAWSVLTLFIALSSFAVAALMFTGAVIWIDSLIGDDAPRRLRNFMADPRFQWLDDDVLITEGASVPQWLSTVLTYALLLTAALMDARAFGLRLACRQARIWHPLAGSAGGVARAMSDQ